MHRVITYDVVRMQQDMAGKGWQATDLAKKCRPEVAISTVTRFFRREFQTPRIAKRLSKALGHPPDHYMVRSEDEAVA